MRPVRPEDEPRLLALFRGLSDEARWLRFFPGVVDLKKVAKQAVDVDHRDRLTGVRPTAGQP